MDRPRPDQSLAERAVAVQTAAESAMQRHIREEWEAMCGGVRVALDAGRTIWPVDREHLPASVRATFAQCLKDIESAFRALDDMSDELLHPCVVAVLRMESGAADLIGRAEADLETPQPKEGQL